MNEPFLDFEWEVAPRYIWSDWLDTNGEAVILPLDDEGLASLESRDAIEVATSLLQASNRLEDTGPVLGPIREEGQAPKRYRPMQREHAALFRVFASIDYTDTEAIRRFASQYGLLGCHHQTQGAVRGHPKHYAEGESHLTWAVEISAMQEALRLLERRSNATDHDGANQKLSGLFNSHLQRVQYRIKFDPEIPPRFSVAPFTLLDALWLQFAMAVVGDKRFEKCKFCQRLIEISTEETGFRTHREFCSGACKTKDFRKRKRTALQLAAQHLAVSEIARRTETKSATIRGWLAAATKRGSSRKGRE